MAFLDVHIKKLKPKDKPYTVAGTDMDRGLNVRIYPSGRKSFVHVYAHPTNKNHIIRLTIGKYPFLSLKAARMIIDANRYLLEQGLCPQEEIESRKNQLIENTKQYGTVEELIEEYEKYLIKKGSKSTDAIIQMLTVDCIDIEKIYCNAVTSKDIRHVIARPIRRGAEVTANRLTAYLHAMFEVGIGFDVLPANIDSDLEFGIKTNPVRKFKINRAVEKVRDRYLENAEIKAIVNSDIFTLKEQLQIKLLLITGQRHASIFCGRMKEINFNDKIWDIPANRMKNNQQLLLPLTDYMIEIIKDAHSIADSDLYLFTYRDTTNGKPALKFNALSKKIKTFCDQTNTPKFLAKDCRRTFKTMGARLGILKEHLDKIQAHSPGDVSDKHYNKYDYLKEKQAAIEIISAELEKVFEK